jgi:hypothetical protein
MLRENGAIDFDFDMGDEGSAVNFWHGASDSRISTAQPLLSINADGIALSGGSAIHKILQATATLQFAPVAAQSCQEQSFTMKGATSGGAVSASPSASLGDSNLSMGQRRRGCFGARLQCRPCRNRCGGRYFVECVGDRVSDSPVPQATTFLTAHGGE